MREISIKELNESNVSDRLIGGCTMKYKSFIAINLNDFHSNQNGKPETSAQMLFISAKSLDDAKEFVKTQYSDRAWSVIPKTQIDNNIVR